MRDWQPVMVPLAKGQDESLADNQAEVHFSEATNVVFDKKGAVTPRPGYQRGHSTLSVRNLDASGNPSLATKNDFTEVSETAVAIIEVADRLAARAGVMTTGRFFTMENGVLVDRGGARATRVDQLVEFEHKLTYGHTFYSGSPYPGSGMLGPDFGHIGNGLVGLLTPEGNRDLDVAANSGSAGPGNMARCGTTTAWLAAVGAGPVNIVLTTRDNGARALTSTTLFTDAAAVIGYGDAPVICCDYDSASFFIAYKTTTANTIKVAKVSTAGSVTASATFTFGAGTLSGVWITNSSVSDGKVVVACTDGTTGGVKTKVYNHSIVDQAIDVTIGAAAQRGPVVVGAAQSSSVWIAYLPTDGTLVIAKRSTTAATSTAYLTLSGSATLVTAGRYNGTWTIQHQPIVVNGRVVLGVASEYGTYSTGSLTEEYTWYALDLTDLWANGTTTGSRKTPPMLARGDMDGTAGLLNPQAAVVNSDGTSWRFTSVDFKTFTASGISGGITNGRVEGSTPATVLNECRFMAPQAAQAGDTTVIGGSILRGVARGAVFDIGFQWVGAPYLTGVQSAGGGAWAPGSYTAYAVWVYLDEAGQVHRSAPSNAVTLTLAAGDKVTYTATNCLLTDRTGSMWTEVYITEAGGTSSAAHYLCSTLTQTTAYSVNTGALTGPTNTGNLPLYTDGRVLPIRTVSGDGGVATVGNRCWVSDGLYLYASRTGPTSENQVVGFNDDGPLLVRMPSVAGRVLALAALDDNKLVIGCEHGIYALYGAGPDDVGQGPAFSDPVRISPLGVAGHRAMVSTNKGVAFWAANALESGSNGDRLWLIDRNLIPVMVSTQIQEQALDPDADLAFVPELDQLFVASGGALCLLDTRTGNWAQWTTLDSAGTIASVAGELWTLGTFAGSYTLRDGSGKDSTSSLASYTMRIIVAPVAPNDYGGWNKIRHVGVIGDFATAVHDLAIVIWPDGSSGRQYSITYPNQVGAHSSTWPVARYLVQVRLPSQKMSTVRVSLSATPATATWTALELMVKPIGRTRPNPASTANAVVG